jgi:site-specific DNA recombinase
MIHAYTSQRGKRYRYYVCSHAQKNGWDTCPVKSLPASEIERFVIETIRNIGKDDALAAEVIRKAQDQNHQAAESLEQERRFLEKELRNLDAEMRRLVKSMDQQFGARKTDRLAELQDKIRETEQRATHVREELLKTEAEHIDHEKMKAALSLFDPVWDALLPKERVRVMQLLIERVVYDGENGKVSVNFRPAGIRALAFEAETANRR